MNDPLTIIGGGLAGCEAAYQALKRGLKVRLYEMRLSKLFKKHGDQSASRCAINIDWIDRGLFR